MGPVLPVARIQAMAEEAVGAQRWEDFGRSRSLDFATTLAGVRCRINLYRTQRGMALAVRLLHAQTPTLERLNLHPDLKKLVQSQHGLVVLAGPTGSGKSSTLASLLHEINQHQTRHVITLERPIEYLFRPRKSHIRQREVGRDTPTFSRGLLDALREDPDVIVVGEMRSPRTIRLTLNAAETGHLVLTTMHGGTPVDAVQRIVSSFSPRIQHAVRAQLAECLNAVCSQKLVYKENLGMRLPECEILVATHAVKNVLRSGQFFKLDQMLETQSGGGMWSLRRYRAWIEQNENWVLPADTRGVDSESLDPTEEDSGEVADATPLRPRLLLREKPPLSPELEVPANKDTSPSPKVPRPPDDDHAAPNVIEIQPTDESFKDILSEFEREK